MAAPAPAPAAALYSAASSYINHTKLGASSWHQLLRFLNFDINTFGKPLCTILIKCCCYYVLLFVETL